jgi:D-glycero-D-manno-heptose 1,7-bisphosphate phosphatase
MTIDDPGLWCEINPAPPSGRETLFLDRDGVIVADTHYLHRVEDLRMIAGSAAAISRCNALGIRVVVVTNQAGIGRGYYGWDDFNAVQAALAAELASAGAHLDAVLACAYHGEGREPLRVASHPWRKPNPGMILEAASRMNINLARSWIVGDRAHDLAAGQAGWLPGGTLVSADPKERQAAFELDDGGFIVETAANLADAVGVLIDRGHFWDHEPSRRGPLALVERSSRDRRH